MGGDCSQLDHGDMVEERHAGTPLGLETSSGSEEEEGLPSRSSVISRNSPVNVGIRLRSTESIFTRLFFLAADSLRRL